MLAASAIAHGSNRTWWPVAAAALALLAVTCARAQERPNWSVRYLLSDDDARPFGDTEPIFELDAAVEPATLLQPATPLLPPVRAESPVPLPAPAAEFARGLLTNATELPGLTGTRTYRESAFGRAATDAINLLDKTPGNEVGVQRRNPIINDPRIRGTRFGQMVNSGSYWVPVRPDLDTALSKIDAHLVENVTVIKGPYSVIYGPGFNVIDVDLAPTERFCCGPEAHGSTTGSYKTNGEQWYGRQRFWGGDETTGWRAGYAHATAGDYHVGGSGPALPSSYNSRTADLSYGWDITLQDRLEVTYLRVDQTGIELPAQVFDINFLGTNALEIQYQHDIWPDQTTVTLDVWANRSRFRGDATRKRDPRLPVLQLIESALDNDLNLPPGTARVFAEIQGDAQVAGGRAIYSEHSGDGAALIAGIDLNAVAQGITEDFHLRRLGNPDDFSTKLPDSNLLDLGAFAELSFYLHDDLFLRGGVRGDVVTTNASDIQNTGLNPADIQSQRELLSAYMTSDYEFWNGCHFLLAGGQAQRPPMLTELYSSAIFVSLFQSGFSRTIGQPTLKKERDWQIDASFRIDEGPLRLNITAYHAWIYDYITYSTTSIASLPLARLALYTNTRLATLAGVEASGTLDLDEQTALFAVVQSQEGRDRAIDAPLTGILPLQAVAGIRWTGSDNRWGSELAARFSARQNQVGQLRDLFGLGPPVPVEIPTPGYVLGDFRSFYRWSDKTTLIAGVENFTNKRYRDHLDLRLANGATVFQPGINFYFGAETLY